MIEIVEFSNGANCGKITKEVLEKVAEKIGLFLLECSQNSLGDIPANEQIDEEWFDDGDSIVCKLVKKHNVKGCAWFCNRPEIPGIIRIYSSRSGNQKHESIQIVADQWIVNCLKNEQNSLRKQLNSLYPDRIIKIKPELEPDSLEFALADIKIRNQQRLAVQTPKNFWNRIRKIFSK